MIRYFLYILFFFITLEGIGQYSPNYNYYNLNGMLINPAYAGSEELLTASLYFRSQWVGIEGAPKTQALCIHTPLKKSQIALGFHLVHEKIGIRNYTGYYFNYAYRFSFSGKGKLSLGLKAGVDVGNQESIDLEYEDIAFSDDPFKYVLPNFGFGGYFYTSRYYIGLSVPQLLSLKATDRGENLGVYHSFANYQFHVYGGYNYIYGNLLFQPSVLIKYSFIVSAQMDINLLATYANMVSGGLSYRTGEAVIILVQYKFRNYFDIGYAYDYNISQLNSYSGGSHSIILKYKLGVRKNAANPRDF